MILKVTKGSKLPVSGVIVLLSHNVRGLFVVCCCCFIFYILFFFVNIVLHVYRIKLILQLLQFSSLSTIFVIYCDVSVNTSTYRSFLKCMINDLRLYVLFNYSRLSLSRNRRDPQKQFEISVLRHIKFVVLGRKQFEQPNFTNDYVI